MAAAEAGRRGQAQVTTRFHAAFGHAGLGVVEVGDQALAVFQEGAALVGQGDAPGGAGQQLDAQPGLQRVHAPADDGRRHALGLGGRAERAAVATATKVSICLRRSMGSARGFEPFVTNQSTLRLSMF
jgi:hypothetical protein